MADKYLEHDEAGGIRQKEALVTSTGAPDDGAIPALDTTGRLDTSVMPVGVAADTGSIEASENLSAGDFVNIYNDTTAKCRKADATSTGKEVTGFVLDTVTSGANATVYFEGINDQVTGQSPGDIIYLDTTAGGTTSTAPAASGNIVQKLGRAISATAIAFEANNPIELA